MGQKQDVWVCCANDFLTFHHASHLFNACDIHSKKVILLLLI